MFSGSVPGRGGCCSQALMKNLLPPSTLPGPKEAFPPANIYRECESEEKPKGGYIPDYHTKPKCTPQILINRYMQGETHPVSLLHQLSQMLQFQLEIKETGGTENIPGFYFAYCVIIDGLEYKAGVGNTKKDAKTHAAKLALEELLPTLGNYTPVPPESTDVPPPLPMKEEPTMSQVSCRAVRERKNPANLQIPHSVRDQLTRLMNNHPEFSNCAGTTAAFVIQSGTGCEVIALGTGNYNTRDITFSSGRTVHDSHAVVTARRSLMRFLYRHLLMFFSKTANLTEKSIFQLNSNSDLLSLKSGITLHLYVNQLPKGAAQIPANLCLNPRSFSTWQDNNEISLHLSVEGKVFSVLSSAFEQATSKVVSMSATDKITQWQVLGYQGALLSHFIEPVYVQSILIGDSGCKDIRGIQLSVIQRVEGITSQLPMFYCMERPHISLVPSVATCASDGSQLTHGINWCEGDSSLEVIDGLEGKTIDESPFKSGPALASRLCKAAMFHRFKLVAKEAQRENLLSTSSYRKAKRMAKPYQEAKAILRAYLSQQGFGSWLVKCAVSDNFSM